MKTAIFYSIKLKSQISLVQDTVVCDWLARVVVQLQRWITIAVKEIKTNNDDSKGSSSNVVHALSAPQASLYDVSFYCIKRMNRNSCVNPLSFRNNNGSCVWRTKIEHLLFSCNSTRRWTQLTTQRANARQAFLNRFASSSSPKRFKLIALTKEERFSWDVRSENHEAALFQFRDVDSWLSCQNDSQIKSECALNHESSRKKKLNLENWPVRTGILDGVGVSINREREALQETKMSLQRLRQS